MTGRSVGFAALGVVAVGSALVAGLTIWLLVTQPMAVATTAAGANHDPMSLLQAWMSLLGEAIIGLVRYL